MDEPLSLRELAPPPPMRKGERTRDSILNDAVALASVVGLKGLSIGSLATRIGLSKSGLFAHFGSKEELQRATLARAEQVFLERVIHPARDYPQGLPRLRAFVANWLEHACGCDASPGGCLLVSIALEFDGKPGLLADAIVAGQRTLRGSVAKGVRAAIDQGELRADVDPWQFTFELFGIVLAAHHARRLADDRRANEHAQRAFERLVRSCSG